MTELARLQIGVETTQLAKGEAALEALATQGARTEKAVDGLGVASQRAGRGVRSLGTGVTDTTNRLSHATSVQRNFGRGIQNTAFQVGDFATQIASGGNATVALAQQLPQLLGGFGVLGAVLGGVVAIFGAFVVGSRDASDAMGDLEKSVDKVNDSVDRLQKLQKGAIDAAFGLTKAFETADPVLASIYRDLVRIEELELARSIQGMNQAVYDFVQGGGLFSATTKENVRDLFRLKSIAIEDRQEIERLYALYRTLEEARPLEEQLAAALELRDAFRALANGDIKNLPLETQAHYKALAVSIEKMILLKGETVEATNAMMTLRAEAEALSDVPLEFGNLLPPTIGGGSSPRPRQRPIDTLPGDNAPSPVRPAGGAADRFATDLEALQRSLKTEREFVEDWHRESQDILADRRAKEKLGKEQHAEALLRVEQEYQSRLRDIQIKEQDTRLGYTASFFGAMAQAMAAGGEKTAKAAQVFGAIEATVNAYRAAAQALADPSVPFWGKAAAYASVLATGLGAVSAIRGASSGGGAATAAPAAAAPANTSPRVALTLNGNNFSRDQVRDLINAINEEVEGGAIVRLA